MKATKGILIIGLLAGCLLSCTVSKQHIVTNNAIGTKVGVAKSKLFKKNQDWSIKKAAEKGRITTIGSVDTYHRVFFFSFYKTVVTGE